MSKSSGIETLIKRLGKLDVAELQELQKANLSPNPLPQWVPQADG